jgi:hypothetical protein
MGAQWEQLRSRACMKIIMAPFAVSG